MIYFIQAGGPEGPIKVGYTLGTRNFRHRFRMLQTGNHETLRLLRLAEGDKCEEARLHLELRKARLRGEWFTGDEVLKILKRYNGRPLSQIELELRTGVDPLFQMNYEVVKRMGPCAYYMDPERMTECRWCDQLTHVRIHGYGVTLCAHDCTLEKCWAALPEVHPEDVDAVDRCQICYLAVEKIKRRERELNALRRTATLSA